MILSFPLYFSPVPHSYCYDKCHLVKKALSWQLLPQSHTAVLETEQVSPMLGRQIRQGLFRYSACVQPLRNVQVSLNALAHWLQLTVAFISLTKFYIRNNFVLFYNKLQSKGLLHRGQNKKWNKNTEQSFSAFKPLAPRPTRIFAFCALHRKLNVLTVTQSSIYCCLYYNKPTVNSLTVRSHQTQSKFSPHVTRVSLAA